jgi:GT2 family glycosyltransferase
MGSGMSDEARVPDYSFIIVSWNAQAYLRQCLDSIKTESKGLDVEVIVVDNASSDGSPEMVQAEYPWVVLIRNDANVGFARANNQGIAISSATYLCLVNSDVVIQPGCLVEMKDFLDTNPQIGLAGPKVLNSDGTLQSSCRDTPTLRSVLFRALALDTIFPRSSRFGAYFMTNWEHDDVRVVGILSGCCWFARRQAVEEVGGLNEEFFMYGEDMDWCLRFSRRGWPVVFNPAATITHYGGASSSRQPTRFFVEMQRADLQYWRMHHRLPAFITYYVSVVLQHACRVAGHSVLWLVRPSSRAQSAAKVEGSVACLAGLLTLRLTPASPPRTPPHRA